MTSRSARNSARGLTLIETAAVIVLFALAVSAAAPMLGSTSDDAQLRDSVSAVIDLDARCRLAARRSGPLVLEPDPHNPHLLILRPDTGYAEPMLTHRLADSASVSWQRDGEKIDRIVYDRTGRTQPYSVTIIGSHGSMAYAVSGRTGWTQRIEGESP